MKRINWTKAGMIVSVCVLVLGVLTLFGVLGGTPADDDLIFSSNDGGYARFGSDFYTYVNNNAASAALYSIRTTALLRNVSGFMFIGLGLLSFCYFASKNSEQYCIPAVEPALEKQSAEKSNDKDEHADTDTKEDGIA